MTQWPHQKSDPDFLTFRANLFILFCCSIPITTFNPHSRTWPPAPVLRMSPHQPPLLHMRFSYPRSGKLTQRTVPEMRGPSFVTWSLRNSSADVLEVKWKHLVDCKLLPKCEVSLLWVTSIEPRAYSCAGLGWGGVHRS